MTFQTRLAGGDIKAFLPLRSARRAAAAVLLALFAVGLPACSSDPYVKTSGQVGSYTDIRLAPGDKLRVTVFGEDKLTGDFDVDFNGDISLPLVGTVKVAGLSKKEAEALLTRRFRSEALNKPSVTVEIISFRPFYIFGEVGSPGRFPYTDRMTIVTALAVAGGPSFRASKSTVYIQRGGHGPFEEYPLTADIPVYPGDVIRVPERYF
ncbi:polysaccharide biosynthesis/export family protein [Nostoc sp. NIES-2111]